MSTTLYSYNLPFKSSLYLKNKKMISRKGLLLNVDGFWGEIAPLEGFSYESLEDALKQTVAIVEGKNERSLFPSVAFGLCSANNGNLYRLQSKSLFSIARLGLDRSCTGLENELDLKTPFSENLLQIPHNQIHNTQTVKLKVYHLDIEKCVSYIKKMKKKYPHILFRVDCNQKWSLNEAIYFAKHFKKEDFDYLEEPIKNIEELTEFYQKTRFPIALDETLYQTRRALNELLKNLHVKAFVIKPTMIGGIKEISSFVTLAKKNKSLIVLSSCFESAVGIENIMGLANYFSLSSPLGIDTSKFFKKNFFKKDLLKKDGEIDEKQDIISTTKNLDFEYPKLKYFKKIGSWKEKKSPALLNI